MFKPLFFNSYPSSKFVGSKRKPDYEQKQIEKLRLYLNLDKNDFFSPQKKGFCLWISNPIKYKF